jgi:pimeloyl-ACP methyl ester carboxylesterase
MLVILLVIAALAVVGLIYQALSVQADRRNHPPVGQMVSAGDYSLHLYCTGQGSPGSPTVVLINGASNIYAVWDLVQTSASTDTRVCSYDRAGTGWSDYPATQPTMETHVRDLHTLLQNSGEPGPYIVVGHSIGGIQARKFYNAYPQEVRGMVLVDSSVEGQYQHLPSIAKDSNQSAGAFWGICRVLAPFGIIRLAGLGNAQANGFPNISDEAKAAMAATFNRTENCLGQSWESALTSVLESGEPTTLNDLPLIVLTAGLDETQANPGSYPASQAEAIRQIHTDMLPLQSQLAGLSTNSRQVIADKSGHFIHYTQPDLVVQAIHDVIAMSQPK